MELVLICLGKIKEKYLTDAINEYTKRIKPFCNLKIIELKEINSNDDKKNLSIEAVDILNNISKDDYVVTLEIEGKMFSSEELSSFISNHYTYSPKRLVFIIGSSCGLDDSVKKRSDYKLSFSKMTFPHQLMRVIFLEQIYRSFMISTNHKYHK